MTGNECEREAHRERQREALASLSMEATTAFHIFQESLTQISVDFGGKARLIYTGVESVCRAHGASWPEVYPYIRALEAEFLIKENPRKKGP